ncbi:MAG: ribosomal protein S18-alanine N-acetyltransferase [Chloroflexi bacterium]|nr:ribosomal protein S18-alanine N-acetyltransferase [Chloroflexota bacterium]
MNLPAVRRSPGLPANVRVRPMQIRDLDQVLAIDRASFAMPWPESAYRYELVENDRSLTFVADWENGGVAQVAGCVIVWLVLDEAHIATLSVRPDLRGLGISRALLAAGLQEAIACGARLCTLEVRAGNQPAQALYSRFGFEPVGLRQRYYLDNQEDALIMTVEPMNERYLAWLQSRAWDQPGGEQ